ncbi:hypothetical protein K437DRAFT_256340 [Tilletiaria anomala UBC 951]|uniref:Uncharacterized protein n=1 Tax=Tilletiaria anomala (strain ATCC 24038 / CBS 436.72 / UBC 951) TaxID=1037660 RepID=A0A066W590_TILAU|nr:uncharacterized protein K437DRAFT_256340 [Tilletiaria anomala UBC 951]KDN45930.1 hypothetical protein K437DRAFT_256340 [Tilletiaria anomala UBC 951]
MYSHLSRSNQDRSSKWTSWQIEKDNSADGVRNVDFTLLHYLSGPIGVEGAEPGHLLIAHILDVQASDQAPLRFTVSFEGENGGGPFANGFDTHTCKAIWDLKGVYATSRHIPGVRFAGITHPRLMGTAPSAELLTTWNKPGCALIDKPAEKDPKLMPRSMIAAINKGHATV